MMDKSRRGWIKDILWCLALAGLAASVIRFGQGLGAATGLNDSTPWGLWIAFKLVFVAIAGGGFTLAGMVYIFHLERYRPLLRRAILIALLGYGSFIVSLIFDLGLPWHIYMPVLNWQHHSVMFEIAWCVILYFTVLVLEFMPVALEHPVFGHPLYQFIHRWLHRLVLPLVIAGIVLSTLHQSSLGSLFLIMPHRVHPLWYSPWIPYMFFTSAIAAGLMALIIESFIVEKWFNRKIRFDLLDGLAKAATLPLSLYLVLRVLDLWRRGVLPAAIDGSWQSLLFLAEILLGGLLPLILISIRKVRQSHEGLLTSAILAILGIASQRMSLSMITMFRAEGTAYVPSLGEIAIAFGIPAAAILIYIFLAEHLPVFEGQTPAAQAGQEGGREEQKIIPEPVGGLRDAFAHRSGFAVFLLALAIPLLVVDSQLPETPTHAASGWEVLKIDGNQAGYVVSFPHTDHQIRLDDQNSTDNGCQTCHHLDLPQDEATACWECHSDFYQPSSIFDHTAHTQALDQNSGCSECHQQEHLPPANLDCQACHENMVGPDPQTQFNPMAPAYVDAMHGRCLECHQEEALRQDRPELALCSTCHSYETDDAMQTNTRLAEDRGETP